MCTDLELPTVPSIATLHPPLLSPFSHTHTVTSAHSHVDDKLLSHRIDYDDHDAAIFTHSGHPKVYSFDPGTMTSSKSARAFVTQNSDDGTVESVSFTHVIQSTP